MLVMGNSSTLLWYSNSNQLHTCSMRISRYRRYKVTFHMEEWTMLIPVLILTCLQFFFLLEVSLTLCSNLVRWNLALSTFFCMLNLLMNPDLPICRSLALAHVHTQDYLSMPTDINFWIMEYVCLFDSTSIRCIGISSIQFLFCESLYICIISFLFS